jgi:hypothetical protein
MSAARVLIATLSLGSEDHEVDVLSLCARHRGPAWAEGEVRDGPLRAPDAAQGGERLAEYLK